MTGNLDRHLRETFSPEDEAPARVAREALTSPRPRPRRAPWMLAVALAAGLLAAVFLPRRGSEVEPPVLTITNSDGVISVTEPSGHVRLIAAASPGEPSGGGVILSYGDS